jgi:hypothetical protein
MSGTEPEQAGAKGLLHSSAGLDAPQDFAWKREGVWDARHWVLFSLHNLDRRSGFCDMGHVREGFG